MGGAAPVLGVPCCLSWSGVLSSKMKQLEPALRSILRGILALALACASEPHGIGASDDPNLNAAAAPVGSLTLTTNSSILFDGVIDSHGFATISNCSGAGGFYERNLVGNRPASLARKSRAVGPSGPIFDRVDFVNENVASSGDSAKGGFETMVPMKKSRSPRWAPIYSAVS